MWSQGTAYRPHILVFQGLEFWLLWKSILYEHSLLISTWYHFQFSFLILSYAWFSPFYQFDKSLCALGQQWTKDFTLVCNHNLFTLAKSQSKSKLTGWEPGASVQIPSSILLMAGKTNLLVHRLWSGIWKRRALKKLQPDSELRNRLLCKKAIVLLKKHSHVVTSLYGKLKADRALTSQPRPLKWAHYHYLDHLLADSHECVVQFWVHHLCLLQLKHLLVAPCTQLLLDFFQAFNNLQHNIAGIMDTLLIWFCHTQPCVPLMATFISFGQLSSQCLDFIKVIVNAYLRTCFKLIFSHKDLMRWRRSLGPIPEPQISSCRHYA